MAASRSNSYVPNPHSNARILKLELRSPDISCLLKALAFFAGAGIPAWVLRHGGLSLSDPENQRQPPPNSTSQQSKGKTKIPNEIQRSTPVTIWPTIISELTTERTKFNDAVDALGDGLVVLWPASGLVLRLHDEVRSIVQERARQKGLETECRNLAAKIICGAYPSPESASCWPNCEQLLPHVMSLAFWDDPRKGHDRDLLAVCRLVAQTMLSRAW